MCLVHHLRCPAHGHLHRRHPWDGDAKSGAPAQPRLESHAAAELLRHQIENDMQAETGAALVAPRGEEWIEGAPLNLLAHADTVVGYEQVDVVAHLPRLDDDAAGAAVWKSMDHAIEK